MRRLLFTLILISSVAAPLRAEKSGDGDTRPDRSRAPGSEDRDASGGGRDHAEGVAKRDRPEGREQAEPGLPPQDVEDLVLRAQGLELHRKTQWLRLGYYRERLHGGVSTEVDGPFFLSKRGATDPAAELEATLRGFFREPAGDEHPRCLYPARYLWLSQQLGFDRGASPQKSCPKLEQWRKNLDVESASLIFSSYFLGSAASAFGHTLLRLNRPPGPDGKRRPLLDVGINYAASVRNTNALLYAVQGLAGMFRGEFTAMPYFYKVRQYNDYDSRDLWEYELNLSDRELELLIAHLWELGNTYFDYWYLSENCSYHILTTLEAVKPELDLRDKVHWPVIPADTLKAVASVPGLVRRIDFRPSARTQLAARTQQLSGEERSWVKRIADDPTVEFPAAIDETRQILVLDAAADLIDVRFAKDFIDGGADRDTEGARRKQALLTRRAAIGRPSPELEISTPWHEQPDTGHPSRRLTLGGGYAGERGAFSTVRMRLAMHDLADSSRGYPDTTRLEFAPTTLRIWLPDNRVALEDFYLVRVANLAPVTRFNQRLSWRMDAGMRRVYDQGCDDCLAGHAELGGGLTFGLGRDRLLFYLMSDVVLGWGPDVDGVRQTGFRGGIGPGAGLRIRWMPDLISLATGAWHWLPDQPSLAEWQARFTTRWSFTQNMAINLEGGINNRETEARSSWMIYF